MQGTLKKMLFSFLPRIQIIFYKRFKHPWQVHQHLWCMNCRNKDSSHDCAGRGVVERRHEEPLARAWDTRQSVPRSGDAFLLHILSGWCSFDILPVDSSPSDYQPHMGTSSPGVFCLSDGHFQLSSLGLLWYPHSLRGPVSAFFSFSLYPHSLRLHSCPHDSQFPCVDLPPVPSTG